MASLCKRQQCTIERRGFRQELDSWRHKLIHCVGFESILEGLFGPGLIKDLTLFQDCEPEGVSDWSFDENCLFCCLRREKVKEHLAGLNNQVLLAGDVCKQEQSKINRLEKQAEEFLNAVFYRKADIPSFSDPHIPLVAREIMQRMIRQFAAEYTSKTSTSQDPPPPNGTKDQSPPKAAPLAAPPAAATIAVAASAQNPVLSKLLMADQDSPLDLTIKKPDMETRDQDGVLDLSTKRGHHSTSGSSLKNSHGCSTPPVAKGDLWKLSPEKVRELQSVTSLEQFMGKLCPHHQRQIIDALRFLQTEVRALAVSQSPSAGDVILGEANTHSVSQSENVAIPSSGDQTSTTKMVGDLAEAVGEELVHTREAAVLTNKSAPHLHSCGPDLQPKGSHDCIDLEPPLLEHAEEGERVQLGVQTTSVDRSCNSAGSGELQTLATLEEHQANSEAVLHPSTEELNKKHGLSGSRASQEDLFGRPSLVKISSSMSPRTARKSNRSSFPQTRDPSVRHVKDPDSQYDIVYISKSITECQPEPKKHISVRRNARKSTRGYKFVEEICCLELKTVRTVAQRSSESGRKGNCPTPMAEVITTVAPKQTVSKPDGIPPVDIPFAGGCGETAGQKAHLKKLAEIESAGDEDVERSEVELRVETSQTDQPRPRGQVSPHLQEDDSGLLAEVNQTDQEGPRDELSTLQGEEVKSTQLGRNSPKDHERFCPLEGISPVMEPLVQNSVNHEVQDCQKKCDDLVQNKAEFTSMVDAPDPLSTMTNQPQEDSNSTDNDTVPIFTDPSEKENKNNCDESRQQSDVKSPTQLADLQDIFLSSKIETVDMDTALKSPESNNASVTKLYPANNADAVKDTEAAEEHTLRETDGICSLSQGNNEAEITPEMGDSVGKSSSMPASSVGNTPREGVETQTQKDTQGPKSKIIPTSDRRLRNRPTISCEHMEVSIKNNKTKYHGFRHNTFENILAQQSQNVMASKNAVTACLPAVCNDQSLSKSPDDAADKIQLSSDDKTNDFSVVESRVRTRQSYKSMSKEEVTQDKGRHDSNESCDEGMQRTPTALEETATVNASVKSEVPDLDFGLGSAAGSSEQFGGAPLRRESRRIAKSMSSVNLMKHGRFVPSSQSSQDPERPLVVPAVRETEQSHPDSSIAAVEGRSLQVQKSSPGLISLQTPNASASDSPKFLEALRENASQQLIASLNSRYDKMQKGWIQLDKEGQPIAKPKNRGDRLKDIWKSKRRIRKPRSSEGQKYSPVQMLFMKTFDLATICRWFLQSTETKSLVIVKKINTRLPSETQLGFQSSSGAPGTSRGVFPSLQAERLKKHLKKFPVASPVKSNVKNLQLIAKAREHSGFLGKGVEKIKEQTSATRISTKPNCQPVPLHSQVTAIQQTVTASANLPASARILRKYSNIREKLQGQGQKLQSSAIAPVKTLLTPKHVAKKKLASDPRKKATGDTRLKKSLYKEAKAGRKDIAKGAVGKEARNRSDRLLTSKNRKDGKTLKTVTSSRLPMRPQRSAAASTDSKCLAKHVVPAKTVPANKKMNIAKVQKQKPLKAVKKNSRYEKEAKKPAESSSAGAELPQRVSVEAAPSPSKAQVVTRSQRKMEAVQMECAASKFPRKRNLDMASAPVPTKSARNTVLKTDRCPESEAEALP
ncbi:hypothetical protein GN956_G23249 [Arapaima gigas]